MRKFVALSIILIGFFGMYSCTWNQSKQNKEKEVTAALSPDAEFLYEFCDNDPVVWLEYNLVLSNQDPEIIYSFDYKTRRTYNGLLESFSTIARKDVEDPALCNLKKYNHYYLNQKLFAIERCSYDVDNEGIFKLRERNFFFREDIDKKEFAEEFFTPLTYDIWVGKVLEGIENGSVSNLSSLEGEDDEYNDAFNATILNALQKEAENLQTVQI